MTAGILNIERSSPYQWAGIGLIVAGVGWIGVSQLFSTIISGAIGAAVEIPRTGTAIEWAGSGLAVVHLFFGGVIIIQRQAERISPLSFRMTVGVGTLAFFVSSAAVMSPNITQQGILTTEIFDMFWSFPVFVCYIAAWLFPIGFASERKHRYIVFAAVSAVPSLILLMIPLSIILEGGWLIVILIASFPAVLALIVLTAICGFPLFVAGRIARSQTAA